MKSKSQVSTLTENPKNTSSPLYIPPKLVLPENEYSVSELPTVDNGSQLREFLRFKTMLLLISVIYETSAYQTDPTFTNIDSLLLERLKSDMSQFGSGVNLNINNIILNSDNRSGATLVDVTDSTGKKAVIELWYFINPEDVWKLDYYVKRASQY